MGHGHGSQDRAATSSGTSRDADRFLPGTRLTASSAPVARRGRLRGWNPESNQTSRMFISFSNVEPAHFRHVRPSGNKLVDRTLVPRIGAVPFEHACGFFDQLRRCDRFAAADAINRWNGNAPGTLPRDAPVGPPRHHVVDAVVSPCGYPFDLVVDRVQRGFAQRAFLPIANRGLAVHTDEPLRCRKEDHGVVAAPAVWVLM